jgi:hypothetical protein
MNYTKLFYWLTVADNAKTFFIVLMSLFTIVAVVSTIGYFIQSDTNDKESQAMARRWMWWSFPFAMFFWSLFIFTPSKKDALLIVAGGQTLNYLTTDSISKQIPRELSSFVVTQLKSMAKDAAVDLNISDQKDKMLEKAKTMTAEQLMSEMKKDTSFARVILDK